MSPPEGSLALRISAPPTLSEKDYRPDPLKARGEGMLHMWGVEWGVALLKRKKGQKFLSNPLILLLASPRGVEPRLQA